MRRDTFLTVGLIIKPAANCLTRAIGTAPHLPKQKQSTACIKACLYGSRHCLQANNQLLKASSQNLHYRQTSLACNDSNRSPPAACERRPPAERYCVTSDEDCAIELRRTKDTVNNGSLEEAGNSHPISLFQPELENDLKE